MSRNHLNLIVFFAGLVALGWIAAGYVVGLNPLALVVTIVIGAAYVAGALELRRYQQATGTLTQAVAGLSEQPPKLGAWLEQLHPSLRNAVRLRVEGERVALPGPALTPYLVGLLVLLGMLGTLLGMVMTLKGTGRRAGERHRPAGDSRVAGGAGQGPGVLVRHLDCRCGHVCHAGVAVRAVPA